MRTLVIVLLLLLAYLAFEAVRIVPLMLASTRLVADAFPFSRAQGANAALVVGDSTGVGVGATLREDSVAGRIAAVRPDLSIENRAVSGARIHNITTQLSAASKARYALVVIQVGANDIIRFAAATHSAKRIEPVLFAAAARADRVIFLSAGNVGGAYLFPFLLRLLYHYLTRSHHSEFERAAARAGVTYVNLYTPPHNDPFTQKPSLFLAEDGLHPSSEGYRLWFDKAAKHL